MNEAEQGQVNDLQDKSELAAAQFEELRTSVLSLASRVHGLSSALDVVNEVQRAQQSIDKRTVTALEAAQSAEVIALRAEHSIVPREELDAREAVEADLRRSSRRVLLRRLYLSLALVLVLVLAVAVFAVKIHTYQQRTQQQLDALRAVAYNACVVRSGQWDAQAQLYRAQIEAERTNPSPNKGTQIARVRAYQHALDSLPSGVDCVRFRTLPR